MKSNNTTTDPSIHENLIKLIVFHRKQHDDDVFMFVDGDSTMEWNEMLSNKTLDCKSLFFLLEAFRNRK